MNSIIIFTDGSSRGNPGPGGWGAVIVNGSQVTELGGGEQHTTNNRMELSAVIGGLKTVSADEAVTIYSDSSYVINGITKWVAGWKRNGWLTKTKDEVQNKDLWMDLDALVSKLGPGSISWKYVGGHVGIAGNERCDVIATSFADGEKAELYNGPIFKYSIPNILDISHDEIKVQAKKSSSSRSNKPAYSYVSAVGGKIQIHRTWAECEKRVKGVKGARFKKSFDAMNEMEIVSEFGGH